MSNEIDNILANLGVVNSTGPSRDYSELQIGENQIDTRFESTFDIIRKAALAEKTPNILGNSDAVEAIVLRSEPSSPSATMDAPPPPGGLDSVAYCRVISGRHTTLLPDPETLDPPDFRSQSLISAFPKFRYSSRVWGVIPAGLRVRVVFDPGSLSTGLLKKVVGLAASGASAHGPMAPGPMGPLPGLPNHFTNPAFLGSVTNAGACPSVGQDPSNSSAGVGRINGSDTQTGKQLHQNNWEHSTWTVNPVSNFILPIKPSEGRGTSTTLAAASGYNRSSGKRHGGVDISAHTGTPLYAIQDGVVVDNPGICRGNRPSTGGNMFQYKTLEGYYIRYVHMDMPSHIQKGQPIKKGQLVGYVGNTGASQAAHLHWDISTERIKKGAATLHPADFYPPTMILAKWDQQPLSQQRRASRPDIHVPSRRTV